MQLLFIVFILTSHTLASEMVLRRMRNCYSNRPNIFNLTNKIENGMIKEGASIISRDIGNLPGEFTMMHSKDGNRFVNLTSFKSNNVCSDFTMYLGDTWVDYQKSSRMPHPGTCPIEKGRYFLKGFKANLKLPGWQALPKGIIRLIVKVYNVQRKNELSCIQIEALKK